MNELTQQGPCKVWSDADMDEVFRKGVEIYDTRLKPIFEPQEHGRFVVINVDNGDYALGDTTTEAGAIMRQRYPGQVFYEARVGFDFVTVWMTP